MKKASKKQKSLKYARRDRLDWRRLIMGILFVGAASLVAAYSFAIDRPKPPVKPPGSSSSSTSTSGGGSSSGSSSTSGSGSSSSSTSSGGGQESTCSKSPDQVGCCPNSESSTIQDNCIVRDINTVINFLSAGVAIVIIGSIVVGGIQYMAAGDKAEDLAKAKHRIANALIALFVFLFTFAFLEWLVPGGLFK